MRQKVWLLAGSWFAVRTQFSFLFASQFSRTLGCWNLVSLTDATVRAEILPFLAHICPLRFSVLLCGSVRWNSPRLTLLGDQRPLALCPFTIPTNITRLAIWGWYIQPAHRTAHCWWNAASYIVPCCYAVREARRHVLLGALHFRNPLVLWQWQTAVHAILWNCFDLSQKWLNIFGDENEHWRHRSCITMICCCRCCWCGMTLMPQPKLVPP